MTIECQRPVGYHFAQARCFNLAVSRVPKADWPWRTKPDERIYAFEMIKHAPEINALIRQAKGKLAWP